MGLPFKEILDQMDTLDFVCSEWEDKQDLHTRTICYKDPIQKTSSCEEITLKSQDRQGLASALPCKRFESHENLKRLFGEAYEKREFLHMDPVDKEEIPRLLTFDKSQT